MSDDLTPSAVALAEALRHPKIGKRIRERIHFVSLSRYVHGRRRPDLDTAAWLEQVTHGAVSMRGWAKPIAQAKPRAA